ncbi:MAG TPA: HD domain-containing protein [Bacillus sp. (in: firmicutes)]|uniref:HD domain-containing protein n=1 Tax=Bacillus litorisediminis TaxID=2922713 RepID=UPI001FAD09B4|nr:HD domain-containing protein [Bacillus litorisediminis]HWO76320.1 HD domain-containing protein [Bacillus sp. (in: firmicutes)]
MINISLLEQKIKNLFLNEGTGHDWFHIDRVRRMALYICQQEGGNHEIVEAAALLHDVPDEKLNHSKEEGIAKLNHLLDELPFSAEQKKEIADIVLHISFKGGNETKLTNLNAKIVRDADRLDAIGAIGIARTFAYGGSKGNPIYNPEYKVRNQITEEEYRNQPTSVINHFYEKLLKLKDLMTTETGKKLAVEKHEFMEIFLKQFYREWNNGTGMEQETPKKV